MLMDKAMSQRFAGGFCLNSFPAGVLSVGEIKGQSVGGDYMPWLHQGPNGFFWTRQDSFGRRPSSSLRDIDKSRSQQPAISWMKMLPGI